MDCLHNWMVRRVVTATEDLPAKGPIAAGRDAKKIDGRMGRPRPGGQKAVRKAAPRVRDAKVIAAVLPRDDGRKARRAASGATDRMVVQEAV